MCVGTRARHVNIRVLLRKCHSLGQIADERFLVFINDMLASGNIPELFTREEYDGLMGGIRNMAKAAGVPDDRYAYAVTK